MATYLFYDVETTGLNVAFDQVLHFAAARTDEDFNIIDEHDIRVRLRPDVVPAPEAVVTHRIPVRTMRDEGVAEVEAIRTIHALLNEPGTTSLGYNSLAFDDEVLRFSFYRNLLSPYTHQYANQCGRLDIYPMAVMYWLAGSDALRWSDEDGAFKLEALATSNGFDAHPEHRDHDAAHFGGDFVEGLHGFDDTDRSILAHPVAHFHKRFGVGLRFGEEGAHHGAFDHGDIGVVGGRRRGAGGGPRLWGGLWRGSRLRAGDHLSFAAAAEFDLLVVLLEIDLAQVVLLHEVHQTAEAV